MAKRNRKVKVKQKNKVDTDPLYSETVIINGGEELQKKIADKAKDLVDIPKGYKIRILLVNESSILGTGFSNYGKEVFTRLYKTGKYEIAELGSYVAAQQVGIDQVPWKHYAVLPDIVKDPRSGKDIKHPQQQQEYRSKSTNQFGEWRFTEALLDFKPDIVIDVRDWWMVEFEERNELRKNFIWILLVPVDGAPQKYQWIATYERADKVLSYSEFGKKVLEAQSGGRIKVDTVPSPGADINVFKPIVLDKEEREKIISYSKENHHIRQEGVSDKDILKYKYLYYKDKPPKIIGTVMRNQIRKLFPRLIQAFRMYRDKYPEQFKGTYLYLHTSIPDVGWNIHESLRRTMMLRSVVFTYMCHNPECGHIFATFIMGDENNGNVGKCQACGEMTARTPNTQNFISREKLAEIYNLFDVYTQFSISEGFGMPIVEAKACGVPIMCTKNTAMEEQGTGIGRGGGGFHIDTVKDGWYLNPRGKKIYYSTFTESLGRDTGTGGREWDLPSRAAAVEMWNKFFKLSKNKRDIISRQARECVVEHYDWDKCAKTWDDILDKVKIKDRAKYWDLPMHLLNEENISSLADIPEDLNDDEFIIYLYKHILCQDVQAGHDGYNDWINSLNNNVNRQQIINFFLGVAKTHNDKEGLRTGIIASQVEEKQSLLL